MTMLCIWNTTVDPAFNLALEEYCLTRRSEDFFLLWRNRPAIIVGKNQNARAEIDTAYVKEMDIPVIRRLSGGGAVFHDLGNVNFTCITTQTGAKRIDLHRFAEPVLLALQNLGVPAAFDGRNDIAVNGAKISGNAQYVHHNRVLHHGTLLFSADTSALSQALRPDPLKLATKAVASVKKRVVNIADFLPRSMDVESFIQTLLDHVGAHFPDSESGQLGEADTAAISALRDAKYATWEWNFGAAPRYTQRYALRTQAGGTVEAAVDVRRGYIRQVRIWGDYFGVRSIDAVEQRLQGTALNREALQAAVDAVGLQEYLWNVRCEELLAVLLGEPPAQPR